MPNAIEIFGSAIKLNVLDNEQSVTGVRLIGEWQCLLFWTKPLRRWPGQLNYARCVNYSRRRLDRTMTPRSSAINASARRNSSSQSNVFISGKVMEKPSGQSCPLY
jgi:hypothetical protein